ncbi:hypothetical protein HK100_009844 [Physocladia obscura]|uniref:Polyketide synthase n=1 Tax=Physocladia obscura TaxID=109957 RepID=A0AAD5T901_9FUNG|nr:hypothetical protein HK100_009844 [Physocladia obscura]
MTQIAIVGIGLRFPGDCKTKQDFLSLLKSKKTAISSVPSSRWDKDRFGIRLASDQGGFLSTDDITSFDSLAYGVSAKEADYMDPHQRLLIDVAREALDDAGVIYRGTKTGCFIAGSAEGAYIQGFKESEYCVTGSALALQANRISFLFDLSGPSAIYDTACSSSLVALHSAILAIEAGDCPQALVGGVNLMLTPALSESFSSLGTLSQTGIPRAFDADADGYVRVNSNGKGMSITMPDIEGQKNVIQTAYARAGRKISDAVAVECHGTGTPVGDPIEIGAIGACLLESGASMETKISIGTVKNCIGHLEYASGMAGLVKACLMLDAQVLLPTINCHNLSPKIPWSKFPIKVQLDSEPMPDSRLTTDNKFVMSVSSFGFGGVNCHVVLETESRLRNRRVVTVELEPAGTLDQDPILWLAGAIQSNTVTNMISALKKTEGLKSAKDINQVAFIMSRRSRIHPQIAFAVGSDVELLTFDSPVNAPFRKPNTVFVFSGQGPQHPNMGKRLYQRFSVFKRSIDRMDATYFTSTETSFLETFGLFTSTKPCIFKDSNDWPISAVVVSLVFYHVALFDLWNSLNIAPQYVMGHSVGEVAALYAAGAITSQQAVHLAIARVHALGGLPDGAGMIALGCKLKIAKGLISDVLSEDSVYFEPTENGFRERGLWVSAINSDSAVSVSGNNDLLEKLCEKCENLQIFARILKVGGPFHSPLVEVIKQNFIAEAELILKSNTPRSSKSSPVFISTVDGQVQDLSFIATADYCWSNIREAVNFVEAAKLALSLSQDAQCKTAIVEISPHPVLSPYIESISQDVKSEPLVTASAKRPNIKKGESASAEDAQFLRAVGDLVQAGCRDANFSKLFSIETSDLLLGEFDSVEKYLPAYPIQIKPKKYYVINEEPYDKYKRIAPLKGPLYGSLIAMSTKTYPWVKGHTVDGSIVFPAAGYLESAFENGGRTLKNIHFIKALTLQEGESPIYVGFCRGSVDGNWSFKSSSGVEVNESGVVLDTKHCTGYLTSEVSQLTDDAQDLLSNLDEFLNKMETAKETEKPYDTFESWGFGYSREFKLITSLKAIGNEYAGILTVPESVWNNPFASNMILHPGILDSIFQITAAWLLNADVNGSFLPAQIDKISILASSKALRSATKILIVVKNYKYSCDRYSGNIVVLDLETREVLLEIRDFVSLKNPTRTLVCENPPLTIAKDVIKFFVALDATILSDSGTIVDLEHSDRLNELRISDIGFLDRLYSDAAIFEATTTAVAASIRKLCKNQPANKKVIRILELQHPSLGLNSYVADLKSNVTAYIELVQLKIRNNNYEFDDFDSILKFATEDERIRMCSFDLILGWECGDNLNNSFSNWLQLLLVPGGVLIWTGWACCATPSFGISNFSFFSERLTLSSDSQVGRNSSRQTLSDSSSFDNSGASKLLHTKNIASQNYGLITVSVLQRLETLPLSSNFIISTNSKSIVIEFVENSEMRFVEQIKSLADPLNFKIWVITNDTVQGCMGIALTQTLQNEFPGICAYVIAFEENMTGNEKTAWLKMVQDFESFGRIEPVIYVHNGEMFSKRFWECPRIPSEARGQNWVLDFVQAGSPSIENLAPHYTTASSKITEYGVLLQIKSVAMNFKNVLSAVGLLPPNERFCELSGEVTRFNVGDHVMGFSPANTREASLLVASEHCLVKMPRDMSFDEAACFTVAYATAWYSLIDVGKISEGDAVLIHAASGGVGVAAVQIAQRFRCKIFCTVGTQDKREFLSSVLQVPFESMGHSRSHESWTQSAKNWLSIRGKSGFDIILNSLQGQHLHAGCDLLAPLGKFVDIGKRDILAGSLMSMSMFAPATSYNAIELGIIAESKPKEMRRILDDIVSAWKQKKFIHLVGHKFSNAKGLLEAYSFMKSGAHIGKIAVDISSNTNPLALLPSKYIFDISKTYILVGGCGGLGPHIALWMIRHGAQTIFLTGRRGKLDSLGILISHAAVEAGGRIIPIAADATNTDHMKMVVAEAMSIGPIGGVMLMTVVLDDDLIVNMTQNKFNKVAHSKIEPLRILQNCIDLEHVDFLILFSSVVVLCSNPGQSNYSVAQAYFDYIAALLPNTCSIAVPAIKDVGIFAKTVGKKTRAKGSLQNLSLDSTELFYLIGDAIERIMSRDGHLPYYVPGIAWDDVYPWFPSLQAGISHLCNHKSKNETNAKYEDDPIGNIFIKVMHLNLSNIDTAANLNTLGLDSLAASQISMRLENELGIKMSQIQLLGNVSIDILRSKYLEHLQIKNMHGEKGSKMVKITGLEKYKLKPVFKSIVENGGEKSLVFPVSFAQSRIYLASHINQDSSYHLPMYFVLKRNDVDISTLLEAAKFACRKHSILKSTYTFVDGELKQCYQPSIEFNFPIMDISNEEDPIQAAFNLMAEDNKVLFDLENGPIVRMQFFLSTDFVVTYFNVHHIVVETWSLNIILREIIEAFKFSANGIPAIPELQYFDYCIWEKEYWENYDEVEMKKAVAFWETELYNAEEFSVPASTLDENTNDVVEYESDITVSHLEILAKTYKCSIFQLLYTCFAILLTKYGRQNNFTIGTPVSTRRLAEVKDIVGPFMNTVAIRNFIDMDSTFLDLVQSVRSKILDVMQNSEIPFDLLTRKLSASIDLPRLIQVMFVFVDDIVEIKDSADITFVVLPTAPQRGLGVATRITRNGFLKLEISSRSGFMGTITAKTLADNFQQLIKSVLLNPVGPISNLAVNSAKTEIIQRSFSNNKELDFNSVYDFVKQKFSKFSVSTAIEDYSAGVKEIISYKLLEERVNILATKLSALRIGKESLVALYIDRGADMVISILAVWKLNAAYVPLDPDFPASRLVGLLLQIEANVIICSGSRETQISDLLAQLNSNAKYLKLDSGFWSQPFEVNKAAATPATSTFDNIHPAYVLFTSGSSGEPKGVVVSHKAVIAAITELIKIYKINSSSRLLQMANYTFDPSVADICTTLASGATLLMFAKEQVYGALASTIKLSNPTHLASTPAIVGSLKKQDIPSHLVIIVGGESLTKIIVKELSAVARLVNVYGPTEATVIVFSNEVKENGAASIIGKPLSRVRAYILDDTMSPVSDGVTGELYLAGPQLASGYFKREDLTAEAFFEDLFVANEKMYKTGDMVRRYSNSGLFEYLGRKDRQIKIRGQRVEIEEVTIVLNRHPNVINNAIIHINSESQDYLIGFVVLTTNAPLDILSKIKQFLLDQLPQYMIPKLLIHVPNLPLTTAKKVNYRFLQLQYSDVITKALSTPELISFVKARNSIEETVWLKCSEILGHKKFGVADNLFEIGMNSLSMLKFAFSLQQSNMSVTPAFIFANPTVAAISANLKQTGADIHRKSYFQKAIEANEGKVVAFPSSFAQTQIWLACQAEGVEAYHMPLIFKTPSRFSSATEFLEHLKVAVFRHKIFRATFSLEDGKLLQYYHPEMELVFDIVKLDNSATFEKDVAAIAWHDNLIPFDLVNGPLLRMKGFEAGLESFIYLNMHHMVMDEWSFNNLIASLSQDDAIDEPDSFQYFDFCVWEREQIEADDLEQSVEFWTSQLNDTEAFSLPQSLFARDSKELIFGHHILDISVSEVMILASSQQSTMFQVLFSCFAILLSKYSSQEKFSVSTPVSVRRFAEATAMIGPFVNTVVITNKLRNDQRFDEFLAHTRNRIIDAVGHGEIPLQILTEKLRPSINLPELIQTMFVFNELNTAVAGIEMVPLSESLKAKGNLSAALSVSTNGCLEITITGKHAFMETITTEMISNHFAHLLKLILRDPHQCIGKLSLMHVESKAIVNLIPERAGTDFNGIYEYISQNFKASNNVAIEDYTSGSKESVSYPVLVERVTKLASLFLRLGVGKKSLIALCMDRGADMIIAILATWKANAAYVPLDPDLPTTRLVNLMQQVQPPIIISSVSCEDQVSALLTQSDSNAKHIMLNSAYWSQNRQINEVEPINSAINSNHPAYVLFTSGSTGEPKGVVVSHQAVINSMVGNCPVYKVNSESRLLQMASYTFDPSVADICTAFASVATLIIFPKEKVFGDLKATIQLSNPTHLLSTPTVIGTLSAHDIPAGLTIFVGGEPLTKAIVQEFSEKVILMNLYGPTEATVNISGQRMFKHTPPNMIGKPVENVRAYVFDEFLNMVPDGIVGELYLGGNQLATEYYKRKDLTEAAFFKDPYVVNERIYKTGDLVRRYPNGELEYMGRKDTQIKIRGQRIELGEIVNVLNNHSIVKEAVVIHVKREFQDHLIAFVVLKIEISDKLLAEIKLFLMDKLPQYMVPRVLIPVDRIPRTTSGKTDDKALAFNCRELIDQALLPQGLKAILPANKMEQAIWDIVSDILGHSKFGVTDRLFEIGMNSLQLLRFSKQLEAKLGLPVNLKLLFMNPTIRSLTSQKLEKEPSIVQMSRGASETGPKVFFFPPIIPSVLPYTQLHNLLAVTSYAISIHKSFETMEDMAKAYIKVMRSEQPTGPYNIAGYSMGGMLALCAASILTAKYQVVVDNVIMYDSSHPKTIMSSEYTNISQTMREYVGDYDADQELMIDLQKLVGHNEMVIQKWKPLPYSGKVTLIHSDENAYPSNGWTPDLLPNFKVIAYSATHLKFFHEPHVRDMATICNKLLLEVPSSDSPITPITNTLFLDAQIPNSLITSTSATLLSPSRSVTPIMVVTQGFKIFKGKSPFAKMMKKLNVSVSARMGKVWN